MNQFLLQQAYSKELQEFSHIIEFGLKKNTTIRLNSLNTSATNCLRLYYILEGKFEWIVGQKHYILYPDDLVLILPGDEFGGERGVLDIGTLCWIHIQIEKSPSTERSLFGKWSSLFKSDNQAIGKLLFLNNTPVLSKIKEAGIILQHLQQELFNQQIGYSTRVNQLIDELFILIARKLTQQHNLYRDFPQTFLKLEKTLRENLSHQWTVEEMAALVGLGTTSFTEKVKSYTGFSPLNYLITIRISEAIRLLKKQDMNVTDIALETGFYSSQHFSTTFKKLTGYTPSEFRKKI
jgi:AraC-like DNA-binding protein